MVEGMLHVIAHALLVIERVGIGGGECAIRLLQSEQFIGQYTIRWAIAIEIVVYYQIDVCHGPTNSDSSNMITMIQMISEIGEPYGWPLYAGQPMPPAANRLSKMMSRINMGSACANMQHAAAIPQRACDVRIGSRQSSQNDVALRACINWAGADIDVTRVAGA